MQITYQIQKLDSGGFMAFCSAMKPVSVFGKTEKEASEKLISAAKLYVKRHPELVDSIRTSNLE